jgi:hypothetical protein
VQFEMIPSTKCGGPEPAATGYARELTVWLGLPLGRGAPASPARMMPNTGCVFKLRQEWKIYFVDRARLVRAPRVYFASAHKVNIESKGNKNP